MPARVLLPVLLVAATALFAAGAIAERHSSSAEHGAPAAEHREGAEQHATEGRVAGVNAESTPLILLGVAAGLGLAAVAAHPRTYGRPAVLVVIALAALGWAALDVREVVHQLDESRDGLATVAALVATLHALAALVAIGSVVPSSRLEEGRP